MQQQPNNNFDQYIKGKLEDASMEAPAFLWNKIEEKLVPIAPWYSRYKYLLLLLLLSFTSASSISIYKNFFAADKKSNAIALNKRMLKDENKTSNTTYKQNSIAQSKQEKSSLLNTSNNNNVLVDSVNENNKTATKNKSSVASFYNNKSNTNTISKNSQTQNKTAAEFAKRDERLKRFEVKEDVKANNEKQNIDEQKSDLQRNLASKKSDLKQNKIAKNKKSKTEEYGSNIPTIEDEIIASNVSNSSSSTFENAINLKEENSTNSINSNQELSDNNTTTYDITNPIVDPIRSTNEEKLYASIVPVKENVTPLSSREALRALVEKDKLESLDFSMSAGVEDLNPNKEKMLKNLKEFAGYSIHKGFHVGAFIAINNVWLNKKQFSADENTSSIKPKVQFGKAYGVNIGYDFTDRLGVELEWQISEQGQKYKVGLLSDNKLHNKDINLMYTKFPILVKYKQTFINNYNSKPIAVNFLLGPQFNVLMKQDVKLDGVKVNNAPQYNKFEFGVLGGFDFDLYMMRYMYLTIGARTGFATSFKKDQPMSFQLGITTQLNFRYAKKIK